MSIPTASNGYLEPIDLALNCFYSKDLCVRQDQINLFNAVIDCNLKYGNDYEAIECAFEEGKEYGSHYGYNINRFLMSHSVALQEHFTRCPTCRVRLFDLAQLYLALRKNDQRDQLGVFWDEEYKTYRGLEYRPYRATILNDLALVFLDRFEETRDLKNLDYAKMYFENALEFFQEQLADKPLNDPAIVRLKSEIATIQNNLLVTMRKYSTHYTRKSDYESADKYFQEGFRYKEMAFSNLELNNPLRSILQNNFANLHYERSFFAQTVSDVMLARRHYSVTFEYWSELLGPVTHAFMLINNGLSLLLNSQQDASPDNARNCFLKARQELPQELISIFERYPASIFAYGKEKIEYLEWKEVAQSMPPSNPLNQAGRGSNTDQLVRTARPFVLNKLGILVRFIQSEKHSMRFSVEAFDSNLLRQPHTIEIVDESSNKVLLKKMLKDGKLTSERIRWFEEPKGRLIFRLSPIPTYFSR